MERITYSSVLLLLILGLKSTWSFLPRNSWTEYVLSRHQSCDSTSRCGSLLWTSVTKKMAVSDISSTSSSASSLQDMFFELAAKLSQPQRCTAEETVSMHALHKKTLTALIKSDVRQINDTSRTIYSDFPDSYREAANFIVHVLNGLKDRKDSVYVLSKTLLKKESFESVTRLLREPDLKLSDRDIVENKRKIERALSLLLVVVINKLAPSYNAKSDDLAYFGKRIAEKSTVHDKHFSFMILAGAILTSSNALKPSDMDIYAYTTQKDLKGALLGSMKALNMTQTSVGGRVLFPYAASALRTYYEFEKTSKDDRRVQVAEGEPFYGSDLRLCYFIKILGEIDRNAEMNKTQRERGSSILYDLKRWLVDLIAGHFITEEASMLASADLPLEIRRNTVAMELLCSEQALSASKKRDRNSMVVLFVQLGHHMDRIMSIVESALSQEHPLMSTDDLIISSIRRYMATVSIVRSLPPTDRARVVVQNAFKFPDITIYNIDARRQAIEKSLFGDDDIFGEKFSAAVSFKKKVRRGGIDFDGDGDDALFASSKRVSGTAENKPDRQASTERDIVSTVEEASCVALAKLLGYDYAKLTSPMRESIAEIFLTWRSPFLLFDYYRMHMATKDIESLWKRYLKALFGISRESVDDIRFDAQENRLHMGRLDPELVEAWRTGYVTTGSISNDGDVTKRPLPGRSDPQTFFMLGEDAGTCMSIRARQKATNRGLLSKLLQGNIRILGYQDAAGVMTERAMAKLLIDAETNRPVIYIENIYSDHDCFPAEVYDQAAELGDLLRLPVVYAIMPPESQYIPSDSEIPAVDATVEGAYMVSYDKGGLGYDLPGVPQYGDVDDLFDEYDDGKILPQQLPMEQAPAVSSASSSAAGSEEALDDDTPIMKLYDYSHISPYIWIDGVKNPESGQYLTSFIPGLFVVRNISQPTRAGIRPRGALERVYEGNKHLRDVYVPPELQESMDAKDEFNEKFRSMLNKLQTMDGAGDGDVEAPKKYNSLSDYSAEEGLSDLGGGPGALGRRPPPAGGVYGAQRRAAPPRRKGQSDSPKSKKRQPKSVQARLAERQSFLNQQRASTASRFLAERGATGNDEREAS